MDKVRGSIGPTVAAYNPRGRSAGSLISCVTIWLIMIFRTIHVAVYIIRSAINARTTSLIVGCIFGVIGTLFVAWCLAKIAIAEGKRRVLGINWGRWHFDSFLVFIAVVSLILMIFTFLTGGNTRNAGLFSAWCIVWVLVSLFTMIAQRPGTTETYV